MNNERLRTIRRNGKFPIYVWSYGASEVQVERTIRGLEYVLNRLELEDKFPVYYFNEEYSNEAWGSSEFYFTHPRVRKRVNEWGELQICATDLLDLCINEPWQATPHIEVAITGLDLWPGSPGVRFVYGLTRPLVYGNQVNLYPGVVLSPYRMQKYYRNPLKIFSLLAIHEFGHLVGLPQRKSIDTEETLGHHCVRADCAMSQVNVERRILFPDGRVERRFIGADETSDLVQRRFVRSGEYFCESCLEDLKISKKVIGERLFHSR